MTVEDSLLAKGIDDPNYLGVLHQVAQAIVEKRVKTVGIAGAQGSGKSTFASLLAVLLAESYDCRAVVLSLDDFYLSRKDRQTLAESTHPLLLTRGVPGTHDMALMNQTIQALLVGQVVRHPVFDKSEDDRSPEPKEAGPADVVLLEGWCWGAAPVPESELEAPLNALEAEEDADLSWRRYVNRRLGEDDYRRAFNNDLQVFLSVPDMAAVHRWRLQQESEATTGKHTMDAEQIRRFIMFYERITLRLLSDPGRADISIFLNELHRISRVELNGIQQIFSE